jgi:Tol biopolymer transport system component
MTAVLAIAFLSAACLGGPTGAASAPPAATKTTFTATTAPSQSASIADPQLPGGRVVYVQFIGEDATLLTANPDGTESMPLLPTGESPRWSPDGRHISIVANSPQGLLFVGLVEPDGSHYVQFDSPDATLELGCFAWSPDGSRLACEGFDGTDTTRNGIYSVRASDGGDLVRITTSPKGGHDIPTDYSPNGDQIVFTRQKLPDEANVTVMVVNVDGSGAHALTDHRLGGGRWSRDGKTILTDQDDSLLLVPIDGGEIKAVVIASDGRLKTAFSASWSPDGEWIVFSGRASKSVDLYIVRADGSYLHQLTDTPIGKWEEAADWTAAVQNGN